ncbi:ABC transporter ATP-binding protein [Agromyces archimandritae]|uniref:ATP-binding cassette domain-containing protein n=1 Tax=Agromyces archimandritae TaxID=2781962 RepID=A0A975FJ05_9MICO|nr:ATP-binding cassette domain-containing protein [Agromyces archimandritae]QTX03378.1 ATP-binding cassette domain-containing protein [Agromyces archimandritae]
MNPRLAADGLTFRYDAGTPLIEGWAAEFAAGEVVAVTGPSGRGKSTMLYLLGLMLRPTAGRVLVDGEPFHGRADADRARLRAARFGFVFQDAALDHSRTVLDNILESTLYRRGDRRADTERAHRLMDRFGVGLRANAKPGQVSGGQAQRIALCRALLGDPDIVLADEPTGNLDPDSSDVVIDAFHERAAAGATVVVVTHDPALVQRCDRNIRL